MSTIFDPTQTGSASATSAIGTDTTLITSTSYGLGLSESSSGSNTLLAINPTIESLTVTSASSFIQSDPWLNNLPEQAIAYAINSDTPGVTTLGTDELTGLNSQEVFSTSSSSDPLSGSLDYDDEIDSSRPYEYAYKDDYLLSDLGNQTVQINLNSLEFDAYLELLDANTGTVIAADDDSGGGTNSQLNFIAQAGAQYVIRATSYSSYEVGSYSLSAYIGDDSPTPPTSPPTAPNSFDSTYGYGLVDAASAVAAGLGRSRFNDVSDTGNNWDNNMISAPEAWAQGYIGQGVTVAVIDSGVDILHEDLRNNIWVNNDEIVGNGIDDDNNGYIDDTYGWSFGEGQNSNDVRPTESTPNSFHGTHVAGTIVAANNGTDTPTGVAYGASIMALRLGNLGNDLLKVEDISNAIYYAVNNGANVINMSLGGGSDSTGLIGEALAYAASHNVIAVMAAGNDTVSSPSLPASYATDYGISVGSVDESGYISDFSNRAGSDSRMQHVMAPGGDIFSTLPNNSYGKISGTSMAAPHVAGVVALMLSANPYLTHDQVRAILTGTTAANTASTSAIAYSNFFEYGNASNLAELPAWPTQNWSSLNTETSNFDWAPDGSEVAIQPYESSSLLSEASQVMAMREARALEFSYTDNWSDAWNFPASTAFV